MDRPYMDRFGIYFRAFLIPQLVLMVLVAIFLLIGGMDPASSWVFLVFALISVLLSGVLGAALARLAWEFKLRDSRLIFVSIPGWYLLLCFFLWISSAISEMTDTVVLILIATATPFAVYSYFVSRRLRNEERPDDLDEILKSIEATSKK
ncbi:hypothetical protein MKQ68_00390 [Chitinophaga horti]|uniref:Uncharacterized protein n=1 Tax=Chitinophaga horti TaxID=2920382 RepID=A0ABY6J1L4_9BACT|nr:hypothetical protein [Chitinophaga horti]UYQ93558.1 hypothetical protein MKQ68_00390 [Chitinophaga horti]